MSTLAEILDALADQIRTTVAATTDVAVQVEPRMVLTPTTPTVDMYPADPSEDPSTAGFGEAEGGEEIAVRVRVDTADHEAGQDLLLAFMDDEDPLSIVAAIYDDPTLDGTAASVFVRARSGFVLFPVFQRDGVHLGCLFNVQVTKAYS